MKNNENLMNSDDNFEKNFVLVINYQKD